MKSATDILWIKKYNSIATKRAWKSPVFSASWKVFTKVKLGIKKEKLRKGGKFGLCGLHSLNAWKRDKTPLVIGIVLTKGEIEDIKNFDSKKYWSIGSFGIVHIWNTNQKKEIIDHTFGSKEAGKRLYIGKVIPQSQVVKFKNDSDVINYAYNIINSLFPTPSEKSVEKEYAKWIKVK